MVSRETPISQTWLADVEENFLTSERKIKYRNNGNQFALMRMSSPFWVFKTSRGTYRKMRTIRSNVLPSVHCDMNSYETFSTGMLYLSSRVFFSDLCAMLMISTSFSLSIITNERGVDDPKITPQIVRGLPSFCAPHGGDNGWVAIEQRLNWICWILRECRSPPITALKSGFHNPDCRLR